MKKIGIILIVILLVGGLINILHSQSYKTILGYGGTFSYHNSTYKDIGEFHGIYLSNLIPYERLWEFAGEFSRINYLSGYRLNQSDYTLVYHKLYVSNHNLKFGLHYINSDDTDSDGGYVLFTGYKRYEKEWNFGFDFYFSNYDDYFRRGLKVYQLSPYWGWSWGNFYKKGSFYFELKPSWINLSYDYGEGENFYSLDSKLNYFYKDYTWELGGWFGEQVFAVKNGGFSVYNLVEKRKGGINLSVKKKILPHSELKVGYFEDRYEEAVSKKTVKVKGVNFSLNYYF